MGLRPDIAPRPTAMTGAAPGLAKALALAAGLLAGMSVTGTAQTRQDSAATARTSPSALTLSTIVAASDSALERAGRRDTTQARRDLLAIVDSLPDTATPLMRAYPYLALARLFRRERDWSRCEAMAAGVAHMLDDSITQTHPFRSEALTLQGIALVNLNRPNDAVLSLRPAVMHSADNPDLARQHRLARYFLGVAATRSRASDAADLRASYRLVHDLQSPLTDADLLIMDIEGLSLDAIAPNPDHDALALRSRALMGEAMATNALTRRDLAAFRGLHANVLMAAGDTDAAISVLFQLRAAAEKSAMIDTGYADASRALARALAKSGNLTAGADVLAQTEAALITANAQLSDTDLALLIATRGGFATAMGDAEAAQAHFRRAYGVARRSLRRSDDLVSRIAAQINPKAPGMSGFAFATEFGLSGPTVIARTDGSDVLRQVLAGRYGHVRDALYKMINDAGRETALLLANASLFSALIGDTDTALTNLAQARELALLPDTDLSPDAPLFDIVTILAIQFGSTRPMALVDQEMERLIHRRASLPTDITLLVMSHQASALSDVSKDDSAEMSELVRQWVQTWKTLPRDSVIADFAAMLITPTLFDVLGEDAATLLMAPVRARHAGADGLRLIRDQITFDHLINTTDNAGIEDRIAEIAALSAAIAEVLPREHALNIWNMASVSDYLATVGRATEARDWMHAALDALRDRDKVPDDTHAYFLHRLSLGEGALGRNRNAATYARQAFDLVNPATARPWAAYPVILNYAIERPQEDGDWLKGAAVIAEFLDDPSFMARMSPDNALFMRFTHARLTALGAPPDQALAALAAFRDILPDDDKDRRDTHAILAMMEADSLRLMRRHAAAWAKITLAVDTDGAWRQDTYGALADASGLSTTDLMRSLEAEIGWDYAQSLK
ncbi:MAG: hypothetical protein ACRBBU_10470 [Pseudooceanicola sp.]